ncbi:type III pantothenate kinase [Fluviispira multicolorata]|uniref:pantothenate kinase n=1 Tax=Fluviispira multicolorata TaxID=2654512 RepID=A0A833JAQ5_9BACT|nr:type III pantothenate kinase [Fluviispira multicolorata]KAB8028453.1 type III pantothenate kinase [Fluviispira multicolorata]
MSQTEFNTFLVEHTTSTMDLAKKIAKESNENKIFAVIAKKQSGGRGRNGSSWIQATNENFSSDQAEEVYTFKNISQALEEQIDFLPITLVFPSQHIKVPYEWLTTLVGCAIYDSLNKTISFLHSHFQDLPFQSNKNIYIKWPNDIISFQNKNKLSNDPIQYKKICGILCETSATQNQIGDFFIGIGLNFFKHPSTDTSISFWESLFPLELNKSEKRILNKWINTRDYLKTTLQYFSDSFMQEIKEYLCVSRSREQLKNLAMERSLPIGTLLSVNKGTRQGEFLGMNENAGLLLKGNNEPIFSGEISIKEKKQTSVKNEKISTVTKTLANISSPKMSPTLAIDFGNTRVHIGFQSSEAKKYQIDIPYDVFLTKNIHQVRDALRPVLEGFIIDRNKKIDFIYTSVNSPEKTQETIKSIKNFLITTFPEIVLKETKFTEQEILDSTEISGDFEKKRLGADRALKFIFAAKEALKTKKNIIVFSFGTAVTCEGVSANLNMLENFIFPGIQMAFNAMHHYTALVPQFYANPECFSPRDKHWNQEIYVQRGVFLSTASTVLTTLKMHMPCKCYLSGGNAEEIIKIINEIDPQNNLDIEVFPSIETDTLLSIKDHLIKPKQVESIPKNDYFKKIKYTKPENKIDENLLNEETDLSYSDENIDQVMQTMLKARSPSKKERNLLPKNEDFRRIGARMENVDENERIDAYMARKFQFHNRETWRERILNSEILIEHGAHREKNANYEVKLNKIKPTYKLKNYDQIWLFHPPEYEPDVIENIDVVFDNGDVCIFSKPPNMVIHAAGLYGKNTFVNIAAKMGYADCAAVHRIDRETSGILTCARKSTTRGVISEAFRQGNVDKMYLAVTKGTRNLPEKFRVNLPIGEPENSLIRLKLWVTGKNLQSAETWFAKLATFEDYTLFACLPQTGRTNQIRIHLAAIGHWIVGDKMYHENENVFIEFYEKGFTQWVSEQTLFPRHMLHNTGIMINSHELHEFTKKPIICELPKDMINSDIVKNLLRNSSIPNQKDYFSKLFLDLHNTDFTNFPEIYQT